MRSFKAKVASVFAAVPAVLAAVLPRHEQEIARPEGKLLHLDLQQNYAQATFSVPCPGCLGSAHTGHDDESLILSFTSHAQEQACGTSNITLNGAFLPQEWNGDFATGSGFYQGVTDLQQNEWYLQRDLDLEWKSACLHGVADADEAAQVLTVNIKAIDGKPVKSPSGFTISFKQQTSPPSLLRLESSPNPTADHKDVAESWRHPPESLRLSFANATEYVHEHLIETSIEINLQELKALEAQLDLIQQAIAGKKKQIKAQLRKEATDLSAEINQCDGIVCIVKTIAHKAHSTLKVVFVHFRPESHRQSNEMGRPEEIFAPAHGHVAQVSGGHLRTESSAPRPYTASTVGNSHLSHRFKLLTKKLELPPRPQQDSPYIVALEVVLGLLCCGCVFTVIRHKCSSLRTRTERAAAWEEASNARAFRRAARKHAWQNWWRGNWARRQDQQRISDYEEKRALIQDQEGVLEDAMQEEIRQLRAVHDVVNDLVRDAEEGRVINHGPCHCHRPQPQAPYSPLSVASTYPPTSLSEIPSRPLSRTDSLPSYRSDPPSEPPSYDSDNDMSGIVANGFRQYTRSTTSEATSHWTAPSSVVDVSPRPSAETLRYPLSIMTRDEDDEEESDAD